MSPDTQTPSGTTSAAHSNDQAGHDSHESGSSPGNAVDKTNTDVTPASKITKTIDGAKKNPHIVLIAGLVGLLAAILLAYRLKNMPPKKPAKK